MEYIYNGKNVVVKIIGGFKIDSIEKEYVICSFDDDLKSDTISMVILELEIIDNEKVLVDIPDEDTEMVMMFYNELKSQALKESSNE